MAQLHGITLDKAYFNPTILGLVFHEFIVKTRVTTPMTYNMLLARNALAEFRGVSVIMWAIEQIGCSGATTALMMADICSTIGLSRSDEAL